MQYLTEDGVSGCFNCDERVIDSKCQEIASKYFGEYQDETSYSICVVDFEKHISIIRHYTIERSITWTEY